MGAGRFHGGPVMVGTSAPGCRRAAVAISTCSGDTRIPHSGVQFNFHRVWGISYWPWIRGFHLAYTRYVRTPRLGAQTMGPYELWSKLLASPS